jgi:hypothetical protein
VDKGKFLNEMQKGKCAKRMEISGCFGNFDARPGKNRKKLLSNVTKEKLI